MRQRARNTRVISSPRPSPRSARPVGKSGKEDAAWRDGLCFVGRFFLGMRALPAFRHLPELVLYLPQTVRLLRRLLRGSGEEAEHFVVIEDRNPCSHRGPDRFSRSRRPHPSETTLDPDGSDRHNPAVSPTRSAIWTSTFTTTWSLLGVGNSARGFYLGKSRARHHDRSLCHL